MGSSLVDPLLHAIGWPPGELARVRRKATEPGLLHIGLLDIAMESGEQAWLYPIVIIQVSNKDEDIGQGGPPKQLLRLADSALDCRIGAWTNGSNWHWYCADESGTLGRVPVLRYDVSQDEWLSDEVLDWLIAVRRQFEHPDPDILISMGRSASLDARLRAWWDSALKDPPVALTRMLHKQLEGRAPRRQDPMLARIRTAWLRMHGQAAPTVVEKASVDSLELSTGRVLECTDTRERAWRIRDRNTDKWSPWRVEKTGSEVQIAVTEWLVGLSRDGLHPLLESSAKRRLAGTIDSYPNKREWRAIFDGTAYMFAKLSNPNRKNFLVRLAMRITDSDGGTPKHGVDFEVWLPAGKSRKKRK